MGDKAKREREKCSQTLRGRSFKSGKFEMVIGSIVFCVLDLISFNFLYFFFIFWNLSCWHGDRVVADIETLGGNLGTKNGINTEYTKTIIFFLLTMEFDVPYS